MKGFLFFFLMSFTLYTAVAQPAVTGNIIDGNDGLKLKNAMVMLLDARDSILVDYARADEQGRFTLQKPANGNYLLVASYPRYADFSQTITGGKESSDLGNLKLMSMVHLIEEVVVKRRAAITIKGDTTEYDASQFKVEKNAKVEDLLKVLPGITVDASGSITAQGKTVKKVLVDGEEFFGNDPTLVTRNIRSDMVDKVQVYERKSEYAERTGVDDGQREQTIDVKLKEDAKNGVFGKALGGAGSDEYYMGQLMFNKFKGSQKLAAYGLLGNNGTTSLNFEDAEKYGGDSGVSYSDDGSVSITSTNDPFSGRGVIGIPRAINTGLNFSDRFDADRHKLNLNYKFGKISSDGQEETNMSGVINNNTTKRVDTDNSQHKINLRYDLTIDSLNLLTVRGGATQKKLWSNINNTSENFSENHEKITSNRSDELVDDKVSNYNLDLLYTLKFVKKGRSLTLNGTANRDETKGSGFLYSTLTKYATATDSITEQSKARSQDLTSVKGTVTYTEPLTKDFNLSLGYGIENSQNMSLIESYNKGITGNYTELDDRFSSNYDFNRLSSSYKLTMNYKNEKLRVNFTNSFNDDRLRQINNYDNKSLKRSFFTYNPRVNGGYNITQSKMIWFNYDGSNRLPALNQIQPILNNADPLNIYEGNENLKPSFSNNVNVGYNAFQILSGSYTYVGGNIALTNNPITQNITPVNGVNYYRWANIEDKTDLSANMWAGHFFKLNKDLGLGNSPRLNMSVSRNHNFVNGLANRIESASYAFGYNITRDTKTGLNFDLTFNPQYRTMTSNLSPDQNNNGFVFTSNGSVEYFLTKTWKVYTNYDYSYEAATDAFQAKIERFLLHPGISKKLLKDESLVLDFMINDVLNRNVGYSRSQSNSVFMQRRYDTIRRYYMLKVSWDFNKMFVK